MCAARPLRVAAALVLASLGSACARSSAPAGWLSTPEQSQREAWGAWAEVRTRSGGERAPVMGELIAATRDSVFVMTSAALVALPIAEIERATLTAYDARWDRLVLWTVLGTLSTASHGMALVLSAPVWIAGGTAAAAAASRGPRVRSTDGTELARFARFPQGMPPGLDRGALRPKDVRRSETVVDPPL